MPSEIAAGLLYAVGFSIMGVNTIPLEKSNLKIKNTITPTITSTPSIASTINNDFISFVLLAVVTGTGAGGKGASLGTWELLVVFV